MTFDLLKLFDIYFPDLFSPKLLSRVRLLFHAWLKICRVVTMIELYLDTVDVEQVNRFAVCLPIKGITTNPSILAKAGIGVNQVLPQMAEIHGNTARFHVQVVSQSVNEIVEE